MDENNSRRSKPNKFSRSHDHDEIPSSPCGSNVSSASSSFRISYSVNSQSEYGFTQRSIEKSGKKLSYVQQLTMKFEQLSGDEQFKNSPKFRTGIFPWTKFEPGRINRMSGIPTEEEVDEISDCEDLPDDNKVLNNMDTNNSVPDILVDEYKEESTTSIDDNSNFSQPQTQAQSHLIGVRLSSPPERVIQTLNRYVVQKSISYHPQRKEQCCTKDDIKLSAEQNHENNNLKESHVDLSYDYSNIPPIEELIKTEESYVKNLKIGINKYGPILESNSVPYGMKGKKWVILGNVEQIAEFHETEFLPMLKNNCLDLKKLFDEFSKFLDENCFYAYVLYTMNKKKSLTLCEEYKDYFKYLQEQVDDNLGINSFLVQPIQRLARYPLLLQQFITTSFKSGDIKYKSAIGSCCKVEKKLRDLLTIVNESQEINDIEECYDINIFYQGQFKKLNEFYVYDNTQRRGYKSKAFIFDKCLVYTEIKDKCLLFRGCYPSEHIGFVAKPKSFTLFYQKRKVQECDFSAEQNIIDIWVELIKDMISTFADQEKSKLKEKYSKFNDIYRRSGSDLIFRNSNRISSDSGVASMLNANVNNPEETTNPNVRTTWYAE